MEDTVKRVGVYEAKTQLPRLLQQVARGQRVTITRHGVAVEDMSALVGLGRDHALSAYDAAYLHLALQEHLPLATRDRALRAAARSAGVAPFVTR